MCCSRFHMCGAAYEEIVVNAERGIYRYKLADDCEPWNLRLHFLETTERHDGLTNHHAHTVVDKEPAPNLCAGMNLDAGQEAPDL